MTAYSMEVSRSVRQAETAMLKRWNRRGEPWAILDPQSGEILRPGLGGLLWVWADNNGPHEKDVTELFRLFSESDFQVRLFSDLGHSQLSAVVDGLYESELVTSEEEALRDNLKNLLESCPAGHMRFSATGLPLSLTTGNIVTHFHPEGFSFTKRDFLVALRHDPLEMRAFSDKFIYVFRCVASKVKLSEYEEATHGYRSNSRDSFWRERAEQYGFFYERFPA